MLLIDGVTMPTPRGMVVDLHDIDAETSGRNANGDMARDRVAVKRRIQLEWPPLSDGEISLVLRSIQAPFFQATYPDPLEGSLQTRTFYAGDRSSPVYSWHPKFQAMKWSNLVCNFIEQ